MMATWGLGGLLSMGSRYLTSFSIKRPPTGSAFMNLAQKLGCPSGAKTVALPISDMSPVLSTEEVGVHPARSDMFPLKTLTVMSGNLFENCASVLVVISHQLFHVLPGAGDEPVALHGV